MSVSESREIRKERKMNVTYIWWGQRRWFIGDRFRRWSWTSVIMGRVSHTWWYSSICALVKHAGNNAASSVWLPLFQSAGERTECRWPRNTSQDRAIYLQECVIAYVTSPLSFNCTWYKRLLIYKKKKKVDENLFKRTE